MRYSAEAFFGKFMYIALSTTLVSVVQVEAKLFPSCFEFLRDILISHLTRAFDDPFNTNEIMLCLAIYPSLLLVSDSMCTCTICVLNLCACIYICNHLKMSTDFDICMA